MGSFSSFFLANCFLTFVFYFTFGWIGAGIWIIFVLFYIYIMFLRWCYINPYCLTCYTCRNLAEPIDGTKNLYSCKNCGNQFASKRHNIDFYKWWFRQWNQR